MEGSNNEIKYIIYIFEETKCQEYYIFNQNTLTSPEAIQQQTISFDKSLRVI